MMDIVTFDYEDHEVRTITDEYGNLWVVAKDAATILGYANANDAINRHCKGVVKRYPLQTPGGKLQVRFINEPDLYRLIVGSHLESAVKFESWIFEEVLPSIRKNGRYEALGAGQKNLFQEFKHRGLKISQRLRVMELAARLAQMDDFGRQQMLETYDAICGELAHKSKDEYNTPDLPKSIRIYFETQLSFDRESVTKKDDLYGDYRDFCKEWNLSVASRENFFRYLYAESEITQTRLRKNGGRCGYVRGVGMTASNN